MQGNIGKDREMVKAQKEIKLNQTKSLLFNKSIIIFSICLFTQVGKIEVVSVFCPHTSMQGTEAL